MHDVKYFELVAIIHHHTNTYLRIRLCSEQLIELYWAIDDATAINMKGIYECDGHSKYRISLHSSYDIVRNHHVASLTKTYRDSSEPIHFDCSMAYKLNLESIKNSKSISDIVNLPFILSELPALNVTAMPIENMQHEELAKKHKATKSSWILTVASVMVLIAAGFSYYLINKATMDRTIVIAAQPKIHITPVYSTIERNIISPVTTTPDDDSTPFSLPYLTMDDSVTYSIPEGYVALTFDDGPSKYTTQIIDILKDYEVGGTFFFLGSNAKKYPDSVRYVQENGYSIGNHSMNHANLTRTSIEEQEKDLLNSTNAIEDITNVKMALFRPPYGALNEQVTALVQQHGYKIVQWNKDPEDWKTQDAENIFKYIRDNKASGSIILLHESQAVIDALPSIIEHLLEQNLQIVNLH